MQQDVRPSSPSAIDGLQQLHEQLAQAEQYVIAGERLLANLVTRIDEATAHGEDIAELSTRLRLFQDTLEKYQGIQQETLDGIERLKGNVSLGG